MAKPAPVVMRFMKKLGVAITRCKVFHRRWAELPDGPRHYRNWLDNEPAFEDAAEQAEHEQECRIYKKKSRAFESARRAAHKSIIEADPALAPISAYLGETDKPVTDRWATKCHKVFDALAAILVGHKSAPATGPSSMEHPISELESLGEELRILTRAQETAKTPHRVAGQRSPLRPSEVVPLRGGKPTLSQWVGPRSLRKSTIAMDNPALLASIPIPWQRMQVLLELLAREFAKRNAASAAALTELASAGQSVFKAPIEHNIPAGALDGDGPMTTSAHSQCGRLTMLLAGVVRRPVSPDEVAERIKTARELGDWIEGTLRPVYKEKWLKVELPQQAVSGQPGPRALSPSERAERARLLAIFEDSRAAALGSAKEHAERTADDPKWNALRADPDWRRLERQYAEVVERHAAIRKTWAGRDREDLTEHERLEEAELVLRQHDELQPLMREAYELKCRHGAVDPEPLVDTPAQLLSEIDRRIQEANSKRLLTRTQEDSDIQIVVEWAVSVIADRGWDLPVDGSGTVRIQLQRIRQWCKIVSKPQNAPSGSQSNATTLEMPHQSGRVLDPSGTRPATPPSRTNRVDSIPDLRLVLAGLSQACTGLEVLNLIAAARSKLKGTWTLEGLYELLDHGRVDILLPHRKELGELSEKTLVQSLDRCRGRIEEFLSASQRAVDAGDAESLGENEASALEAKLRETALLASNLSQILKPGTTDYRQVQKKLEANGAFFSRINEALPPVTSPATPHAGWVQAFLQKALTPTLSNRTFGEIRDAAGIPPGISGVKNRRFSAEQVRLMIAVAPTASPQRGDDCVSAWTKLLLGQS